MKEQTWILDPITGDMLVEGLTVEEAPALAGDLLPGAREMGCARPLALLPAPMATPEEIAASVCVRIAGYYHNSLVEGPGRRTTVKFQGCTIHCRGCITPDSWNLAAGSLMPVDRLAEVLLDPTYERDGISVVGGEPFDQCDGLWALVQQLRIRGCRHILVYSGYTYERLQRMAMGQPAIEAILRDIDVLVDGPFVAKLANRSGPWTGSANQRVLMLNGA